MTSKKLKLQIRLKLTDADGNALCQCGCKAKLPALEVKRGTIYDHRPPLQDRKWNARKKDFIPPANALEFLFAILPKCSDRLTFGPGGEKRITTRGSDIGEKARERGIKKKDRLHRLAMRGKRPGKSRKARGSIPSRPFSRLPNGFKRQFK